MPVIDLSFRSSYTSIYWYLLDMYVCIKLLLLYVQILVLKKLSAHVNKKKKKNYWSILNESLHMYEFEYNFFFNYRYRNGHFKFNTLSYPILSRH